MELTREILRAFMLGMVTQLVMGFLLNDMQSLIEGIFVAAAFVYLGEIPKKVRK